MARAKIPTAVDMMQRRLVTVAPDDEVQTAVRKMLKKGNSGAPVVDAAGELQGVLSEPVCIRVMSQALSEGWPAGSVAQHMTKEVESVPPDEDAFSISSRFAGGRHRRLLVVDRGRLIGLISRRDLLKALEKMEKAGGPSRGGSTYDLIDERRRELD